MHQTTEYSVLPLADGAWSIEMSMVRAFVVAGETSAVLIDTGAGGVNLRQAVRQLTDLPTRIVNTHSHFDHISGNGAFEMIFAHPMEIASIAKAGYTASPVGDGFGFDLGGRILQVVSLPGHSPGSIGLWDAEAAVLFAGDTVARNRPVFLSMEGASVEAYARSLDRILSLENNENGGTLKRIFCAHGDVECTLDTVRALKALTQQVQDGDAVREPLPESLSTSMGDGVRIVRGADDVSLLVT